MLKFLTEVDAEQWLVVMAFVLTSALCVAASVHYARRHVLSQIKSDIRQGVSRIKRRLHDEVQEVTDNSKIDPPDRGRVEY